MKPQIVCLYENLMHPENFYTLNWTTESIVMPDCFGSPSTTPPIFKNHSLKKLSTRLRCKVKINVQLLTLYWSNEITF